METMMTVGLMMSFGIVAALALSSSSVPRQAVKTDKAPLPIGPYSQAVKHGNLVFVSGQLGMNVETKTLEPTVREQTVTALTHIKAILETAQSGIECVLKTTIFLADMRDFPAVNEVYGTFFVGEPPARSTVQVARLPLDGLVEIEAVAYLKEHSASEGSL
jgi:2-iminobutanoate/2-iminopropanoate deaminase